MPVTPGFLRLPPDSTGKMIDATIVTVGGNSVYREVGVIGDPQIPGNYAQVDSSGRFFALSFLTADGSTILGTVLNPVRVDPTATTVQPISGTVTANQGGAPWSVAFSAPQHVIADSGSIAVSNFPATQPVSAASLPLPAGASTEATLALIKAKTDNLDVPLSTRTKPADTQNVSGAVSVSGTIAFSNTTIDVTNAGIFAVQASTKTTLTASSPSAASVGVASGSVLGSNANRKGAIFCNTSSNTISLAVGTAAILNSGITLLPGGVWEMDEYSFTTGQIFAIASGAASNLSIQEFTA